MELNFREIEQFIYREARLMDDHEYDAWLKLWTADGVYWVPSGRDDGDPRWEVSLIHESYPQIVKRIGRMMGNKAFAQDPPSRLRRVVANIEIDTDGGGNGDIVTASNFVLGDLRKHQETHWIGRTIHRLRRVDGILKMAHKKVILLNNDEAIPNLAFLI